MQDGRLLLEIKDAPFSHPILAKFASDGTLKLLAYLIVLFDPNPPQLVGIEEPENHLHPRLLPQLAEECRSASANTQLMVTTHSPFFVDSLKPENYGYYIEMRKVLLKQKEPQICRESNNLWIRVHYWVRCGWKISLMWEIRLKMRVHRKDFKLKIKRR
jgi:hypothetical protein